MKITHKNLSCLPSPSLVYISFFYLITSATSNNSCFVPSDKILLNCGTSGSSSFNGKNWIGDDGSKFMPSAYKSISANSTASNPNPRVPKVPIPFITARIFYSSFTYSFPFSPGLKFIRLYFHPASYSGLNPSKAYFSVTSGHYTLLSNFNPTTAANALGSASAYFTKEFSINIKEKMLNITFIPSHTISNSFAFVNGVEIFSIPLNFYIPGKKVPLPFIGQQEPFFIHDETALQMLYWVNVGYDSVYYDDVVTSIFGNWLNDLSYIISSTHGTPNTAADVITYNCTKSAAPEELYTSARIMGSNDAVNLKYNLTWTFAVDSGFEYLVRLHFCEITLQVTGVNQRVFKVYINNQTAEESLDIIALTGAPFVPAYKDYVVTVPGGPKKKQEYLWLALHPNTKSKPKYADAILNGIEIIKLSDRNNNLAAHIQINNEETVEKSRKKIITGGIVGGLGLFLVCFVAFGLWKRVKVSNTVELMNANVPSIGSSDLCRQFSLAEIKAATNNFNEALVVGSGGFGKVYKGFIDAGTAQVAVKRGSPMSQQGVREFQNEIELLSKFRHMHLVSLIGYCQEGGEMILVYEYMAGGTLRDHLYKSQKQPLEWKLRLKICIDAARGLHHLHTGAKYSIIHRDVKTANILLDDKWMAKVSDFGLSRVGAITASRGHVSTVVKGTFGYMDPEYYRCRKLTVKSDVYSFGVVLFEVLCGRPAVKPIGVVVEDEDERVCLADWARHCHQTRTIDRMIDPYLRRKIAPECLMVFVDVAVKCLADKGIERPSMSDVLGNLEHALQLQEISESDERSTV